LAPIFSIGGMMCLFIAASTQGHGQKIGLFWPVAFHFVNSIGFAHLLPVSLALYAKYAPKAVSATIIGLYYLAFFAANKMVGRIGALLETMPVPRFWLLHAGLAAAAGVCFVIFKLAAGSTLKTEEATAN
jgi:POT family proton-dependent oligopeptide transporter